MLRNSTRRSCAATLPAAVGKRLCTVLHGRISDVGTLTVPRKCLVNSCRRIHHRDMQQKQWRVVPMLCTSLSSSPRLHVSTNRPQAVVVDRRRRSMPHTRQDSPPTAPENLPVLLNSCEHLFNGTQRAVLLMTLCISLVGSHFNSRTMPLQWRSLSDFFRHIRMVIMRCVHSTQWVTRTLILATLTLRSRRTAML